MPRDARSAQSSRARVAFIELDGALRNGFSKQECYYSTIELRNAT